MLIIRPERPISFRVFLAAAAFVVLLPFHLAIGIAVWYDFRSRHAAIETELRTITKMAAAAVDADVRQWFSDLQPLAHEVASGSAASPQLQGQLTIYLDRHPETHALAVIDADGTIIARAGGRDLVATTPLFRAIPLPAGAPGGRTVLSAVQADPIDGTPLIGIAVAAEDGSSSAMSIMALQRLNDINLILAEEDTALGWQAAIVDRDGRAVVASEPGLVGKLFMPLLLPEAALQRESVQRARVDDVDRYLTVAPATVVQWRVVSRVPADVLDAPSRYELFTVLLLGGLLALPVAVSVLLGRYLGNRLEALANAAREVPGGVLSHAMEATGLREIDVVSQALIGASAAAREQAETRERIQVMKDGLELAQRMESVGQVMAGMAHDFGNLIFTIRGNLELLRRGLDADSRERPLIEPSLHLADEAMKLISQLSASARRTRQQTRLVNVNADLDGIIDLLRQVAGRSVTVTMRMDRDLLDCRLDPTLLRSALLNLVVNARKAMPRGGGVRIVSRNVLLDESAALSKGLAAGPYVSVSVEDDGTGIPPELRSRIFEPFFTTRESDGGTGFGLSILDGFVKAVGGHVGVHSVVGQGTRFTLYFPAEHRETADTAGLARGENQ